MNGDVFQLDDDRPFLELLSDHFIGTDYRLSTERVTVGGEGGSGEIENGWTKKEEATVNCYTWPFWNVSSRGKVPHSCTLCLELPPRIAT